MKEINAMNIFEENGRLYTKSIFQGYKGFDEELKQKGEEEYRHFDHERSKLGAAVKKGLSQSGISEEDTVLYLGASHGYTPSYVSDIVGKDGFVLCIDKAPRVVRDLIFVCKERENMAPILADANKPEEYEEDLVFFDSLYQDIAEKNQLDIFSKNMEYVKSGGFGVLALKARSVDISKKPKEVFDEARSILDKEFTVVDQRKLAPFEKDHMLYVVKKK